MDKNTFCYCFGYSEEDEIEEVTMKSAILGDSQGVLISAASPCVLAAIPLIGITNI